MKSVPILTTLRVVDIFEEMISCRRMFCADRDFFRMPEFWEDQCDEEGRWTIKTYRSGQLEQVAVHMIQAFHFARFLIL